MVTTTTPKKVLFVINFFVSAIALLFMGPSPWIFDFGDTRHFWVVLVGLPLLGFIQILCLVFALPEAIEVYQVTYRIVQGVNPALDGRLSDVMSTGYGLFYNFAALVAPNIGAVCY